MADKKQVEKQNKSNKNGTARGDQFAKQGFVIEKADGRKIVFNDRD